MSPKLSKKNRRKISRLFFFIFLLIAGYLIYKSDVLNNFHLTKKDATSPPASAPSTIQTEPSSALSIASFNIRKFTNGSRSDEELQWIAKLLKDYDLIAIQELFDEQILKRTVQTLKKMGFDYAYEISPRVGRLSPELFAFLYRQDKVQLTEKGNLFQDTDDRFIRDPFYASFRSGDFDFTLINVHILWGKTKSRRRPELSSLAFVYQNIQQNDSQEQDIILLGDFNMPPDDFSFDKLRSIPSMTWLIRPPEKTMISDTNLYDNFWFERNYLKEYSSISGINRFDETMFNNNDEEASLAVSDHRLIWAVFQTQLKDDD